MRVLLVGASGQVGTACRRTIPAGVELIPLGHAELDITDASSVAAGVAALEPDVIINAAAYTQVDKAESEREAAHLGNAIGPANLADAIARLPRARFIHLSTDFVFDGRSGSPYPVDAPTGPLSVYGTTKLAGESAVRERLGDRAVILRTAWVYSTDGSNFFQTMLRLMARGPVRVIADQVGTPTSSDSLAETIWRLATHHSGGVFHWTDAGVASWYDFAVAISEEAANAGILPACVSVAPIRTRDFPTAAKRPAYSVLDKSKTLETFGLTHIHWRERLRRVIGELRGT